MQTEMTVRYYLTTSRMFIIKKKKEKKKKKENIFCQGCKEMGTSVHCWWECKMEQLPWLALCMYMY